MRGIGQQADIVTTEDLEEDLFSRFHKKLSEIHRNRKNVGSLEKPKISEPERTITRTDTMGLFSQPHLLLSHHSPQKNKLNEPQIQVGIRIWKHGESARHQEQIHSSRRRMGYATPDRRSVSQRPTVPMGLKKTAPPSLTNKCGDNGSYLVEALRQLKVPVKEPQATASSLHYPISITGEKSLGLVESYPSQIQPPKYQRQEDNSSSNKPNDNLSDEIREISASQHSIAEMIDCIETILLSRDDLP